MMLLSLGFSLFISLVASNSLSFFGGDQTILDGDLAVPGNNPLEYCNANDKSILIIENVDLDPNPPKPGKTLTIKAKGNFTEQVEEGAYIMLSVKYGLITLIRQQADLCEQIKTVDEECPLDGEMFFRKEVDIPEKIPPGSYTVLADVYSADDKPITCLKATVRF